jgi:o-succinylbenzoate---CoA ligase
MMNFDLNSISENWLNQPAIITNEIITYSEFFNYIHQTAINLSDHGFQPGENVAIFAESNESFLFIFMALLQNGIIAVPINNKIPEDQIHKMLSAINCKKLFGNDKSIFTTFDSSIEIFQINEIIPENISDTNTINRKPISFEQGSTIIFTSGSSGNPKAVLHTFGNHCLSALGSNENIAFKLGDRWMLSLPLYHVGGLSILFRAIAAGGAVVVPDENLTLTENIKKYNVSHISLVSTQLMQLLENKGSIEILKKFKAVLIGGSYIPSDLIEKSIKYKLPIFTTYGSTEMASQITTTEINAKSERLFMSGKLLKHRELKISDDGEILVKGKTLFKGYIENNSLIKPFDSDGWYNTGDLGRIDDEGYLSIIGRKDNMFISGGENIYPEEIEKCLMNMDKIENGIVIDIPDEKYGARPVAFIKTKNYDLINRESIVEHLRKYLTKFKIPDAFYLWPEMHETLKAQRKYFKQIFKNQKSAKIV